MNLTSITTRASSTLVLAMLLLISSSTNAFNRNDVFFELEKLNTNWDDISIEMWINNFENDPDPGVIIGDKLIYNAKSSKPALFTFILVDARGETSILKPDALAKNGISGPSNSMTFQTINGSDGQQYFIEQAEPLGRETVYVLASDQSLPTSVFNIDALSDYVYYGADLDKVKSLVARLNGHSDSIKLALHKYQYYVDSNTQFSTRGIKRAVSERVQEIEGTTDTPPIIVAQIDEPLEEIETTSTRPEKPVTTSEAPDKSSPIVINDINFKSGSDVLTSTGMDQLEILGSELIDRQANNQLPDVLLIGHTDSFGSAEYNLDLSERRAISAKRFLVEGFGLPSDYIDTLGMGEAEPIDSNTTKSGRARNRRVEFVVIQ